MAITSKQKISEWFDSGVAEQATHMIVVCDTFGHEDYPVYVQKGQDFWARYASFDGSGMQRIMGVYDLNADKLEQLTQVRANNCPPRGFGGVSGDRTRDLIVANDALSQLSYDPNVM